MALPKKDIRPYFDPDIHAAIKLIAEADGYGDGVAAWMETVIVSIVTKRVNAANLLISSLEASGSIRAFKDDRG